MSYYTIQDIKSYSRAYDAMQKVRTATVEKINEIQKRIISECPIRYKINCINGNIKDNICSVDNALMVKLQAQLDVAVRKCEEARVPVELFFDFLDDVNDGLDLELLTAIVFDDCTVVEAAKQAGVSKSTAIRHCNDLNERFMKAQERKDLNDVNFKG